MAPLAGMSKYGRTGLGGYAAAAMGIRGLLNGSFWPSPIHGDWTAWAAGGSQRVEGHGDTAEEAMADLTNQLRAIRACPNG